VYDILFRATSETLRTIAVDPKHLGAEIGCFAVLHSWGQNLMFHPHLHCVVPGGGLSPDGSRWIPCRKGFFLPVRVLSRLFRRLFLELLEKAWDDGQLKFFSSLQHLHDRTAFLRYLAPLRKNEWVVYAKKPFAGPQQVLDYVGRYAHRVAISNNRILNIQHGQVTFAYKDYRNASQQKTLSLSADEPDSPTEVAELDYRDRYQALTGSSLWECPACHRGRMIAIGEFPPGSIPTSIDTS
jgi:hypothetical protein